MSTITSLFIPKIEKCFNAEFIANVFEKFGIAKVNRILLQPRKKYEKFNKAYIEIREWCDSEIAFNFIMRLRNPSCETRLIYEDDNWWIVYINKYPRIITEKCEKYITLTIFRDNSIILDDEDDTLSTTAVTSSQKENIDYEKTRYLKAILYGYKDVDQMDEAEEFDGYLHEAIQEINSWNHDIDQEYTVLPVIA